MAEARKAALAELNASRAGEKRTEQHRKEAAKKSYRIYDTVEEGVYQKIVKNRLLRDDFVEGVDDMGYADNGEEVLDELEMEQDDDDSEEEQRRARRKAKLHDKGTERKKARSAKMDEGPSTSMDSYRKPIAPQQEDDFMNSIMSSLDAVPLKQESPDRPVYKPLIRKRKTSMDALAHRTSTANIYSDLPSSDLPDEMFETPSRSHKKVKMEPIDVDTGSSSDGAGMDVSVEEEDYDSTFDEFDFTNLQFDDSGKPKEETKLTTGISAEPRNPATNRIDHNYVPPQLGNRAQNNVKVLDISLPSWLAIETAMGEHTQQSVEFDALGPLNTSNASSSTGNPESVLESDGSLRFYWVDYLELEGRLYLVGKVLDNAVATNSKKKWISCCLTVNNLERNLFVKPRRFKLDDQQNETDEPPEQSEVYSDFDNWRRKCKIKSWMCKWVKRSYVFDDVDEGEDPSQAYLKVIYGFAEPQIPVDAQSPTIEKIFGTATSAFELFVLKRKIMGPCWLHVTAPITRNKGVSWCKLEAEVDDPKNINPYSETDTSAPRDTPPMTVMSLSLRMIVNHATSQKEIIATSARFWEDTDPDDPTPPEKLPSSVHTAVRCLDKFPPQFEEKAKQDGSKRIHAYKQEKLLLSNLLAVIRRIDPDVIVSHEFLGVSLDILLQRLKTLKVDSWSCIGRFRRTKWPSIGKQGFNIRFLQGRLLCDLASDAAKSMITSTTWSMTEMCSSHLGFTRQEIDPEDTAMYFDSTVGSPDRLLSFARHCELDTSLQMALCAKVQLLPLTRQLTSLAGNSWNKTLNGGRAERNEYILLHEFHRLKYICPDKVWGKKMATAVAKAEADEAENTPAIVPAASRSKRDKYKGGLVFEPKRGLWDKYILVMDFNSLYPSIIQEYNIDFTTVVKAEEYEDGVEKIPEVPSPDIPQGVLPRLISTLVNRRKQVKGLMKDPKAPPAKLMQWDIKQKALKLTANSMYGCLGFEYSRFYARPLAALTTFKGREILTHTKELAESLQLDVVYGDTDSVFVNSNAESFPDALKMASIFKKQVNDRYKLLEIDVDAVFQRLLLLQKKKYAAIKMEGPMSTSVEIKGLDMKRREFCVLSKTVSKQILDHILSGKPTEEVVEEIHDHLRAVGSMVREGKVTLEDLTIYKRLGRNPEDYDQKNMPHIQVALRMKARGGAAKAGDVIPYLFCLGVDGVSSKTAQADKAKHPDEVRKGGDDTKIDYEYYLSQQILPPIERLCDPIEGTDRSRLAECLGMDPAKYVNSVALPPEDQFSSLESLIPDKERFRDVDLLIVKCRGCRGSFNFAPVGSTEMPVLVASGMVCPSCNDILTEGRVLAHLEVQIRQHVGKYYDSWAVCDEQTCQLRTRSSGVYGRRCMQRECTGHVSSEYTGLQLYNQLLYYRSIFDAEKARVQAKGTPREDELGVIIMKHSELLLRMIQAVERYLSDCGRRWVEFEGLFSFMSTS
ncbi:DNA-directed DNA polymerase alpha catalytic subunit pol1 [Tulasnella sp. JGI-2019a]|nr:DNA-directed DNA polymerase alpha catalytic subunit pol1 [Tulasnella sp. JGI-2019a]